MTDRHTNRQIELSEHIPPLHTVRRAVIRPLSTVSYDTIR